MQHAAWELLPMEDWALGGWLCPMRSVLHGEHACCSPTFWPQIFEKKPTTIKNFGIWVRYQSRTGYHNMYKEYRDVTLNGAVDQLYHEMGSRHRCRFSCIQIIKTATVPASACKRANIQQVRERAGRRRAEGADAEGSWAGARTMHPSPAQGVRSGSPSRWQHGGPRRLDSAWIETAPTGSLVLCWQTPSGWAPASGAMLLGARGRSAVTSAGGTVGSSMQPGHVTSRLGQELAAAISP